MKELKFRPLKAEEIDVRLGQVNNGSASFLLYKDARADMIILDETVGALNWQRKHLRDNKNCIVEIWDSEKSQWISKEDTGTESNTEAEKGLASDSFKRACFNWGIGRELYTAPNIKIKCETEGTKKPYTLKNKFEFWGLSVGEIEYRNGEIIYLALYQDQQMKFKWGVKTGTTPKKETPAEPKKEAKPKKEEKAVEPTGEELISEGKLKAIRSLKIAPVQAISILKEFGYSYSSEIKERDFMKIYNKFVEVEDQEEKIKRLGLESQIE